jgi:hypothetical protein
MTTPEKRIFRRQTFVIAAIGFLVVVAALIINVIPLVTCEQCPREMSGFGCGIEGVSGIRWIDHIYDSVVGGGTYRWVGHPIRTKHCLVCLGRGKITLLKAWTSKNNNESTVQ